MNAGSANSAIEVLSDPQAVAARVSDWLVGIIGMQETVRIALAGGTTPSATYCALAAKIGGCEGMVDKITWFWTDERFRPVSPGSTNRIAATKTLFDRLQVPVASVFPIENAEESAEHCARDYERRLRKLHPGPSLENGPSLFTVVLLGIGADGHTAGLFPGSATTSETKRWVVAARAPEGDDRISLTVPALCSSDYVGFLVTGAAKHDAFTRTMARHSTLPAAQIRARKELRWFCDQDAFGKNALVDRLWAI